jgi:diguanylate cyclase (GGDEF)-like protein/PAS domain S-box-containing protein
VDSGSHIHDVVRHLGLVHEDSPDGVLCLDGGMRVLWANRSALNRAGLDLDQIAGRHCWETFGRSESPCLGCGAKDAARTGEARTRTKHTRGPDGSEVWIEQHWIPLATGLVVEIARDTTPLERARNEIGHRMAAEERLREERNRVRNYLDVAAAMLLTLDREGRVLSINRKGCEVLGRSEPDIVGHDWFGEFLPMSVSGKVKAHFHALLESGSVEGDGEFTNPVVRPDGSERIVEWRNALLTDPDGRVHGLLSSGNDVTDRMEAEAALRFKSFVLDHAIDSIIVHKLDGTVLYANERAYSSRGYTSDEFMELPPFGWVAAQAADAVKVAQHQLEQTGHVIYESASVTREGTVVPIEVHASMVVVDGEPVVVAAGRDISERKEAQETISRMAFYDSLTGLANRSLFTDRLEHAIANAARDSSEIALIFLDLDHFKTINDTLGHPTGDLLLTAVGHRLSRVLREGDTIARIGGDEFTVLVEDVGSREEVERIVTKLLACFREPFEIGQELFITASMGIVLSRGAEHSAQTLLAQADTAMYSAKESGRNAYDFYVPNMSDAARRRFDLKNDLRHALAEGQLSLAYQPQVRVDDGRLVGVEALLRWQHPRHGPIAPSIFLPLAEESGQIFAIGEWTLRQACEQGRRWQLAGAEGMRVAVNLSARQFEDPRLVAIVAGVLSHTGLEPADLELEITETIATRDTDRMRETFEDLRALDVRIAVDDFGTGFSSLDQLMRLDVDTLKIDRRFIRDLEHNEQAAAITSAVILLAHKLGLNVIAEGVETPAHYAVLLRQGCDEMQGFLIGRPMSVLEFDMLLPRLGSEPFALPRPQVTRP